MTCTPYKPLQQSSLINFQVAFYELNPSVIPMSNPIRYGIQWWMSSNLQISGIISKNINNNFNLYNNISLGYYNKDIKWLYS